MKFTIGSLPAGFGGDPRFRDQTAEQNQDGVEQLAMKTIHGDCNQNCVSAHGRREPFVHHMHINQCA